MSRDFPRLARRLILETLIRTPDGAGGYTQSWVPLGVLWAQVETGVGGERPVPGATVSTVPCRITVRAALPGAPSRPRPDQRFREDGRIYRILTVSETDREARFLTCLAEQEEIAA